MEEKRFFTRVEFKIKAVFSFENKKYEGKVENLSLKGLFLKTNIDIPEGEFLKIDIHLGGPTSNLILNLHGLVKRKKEDGLGILFDSIDIDSFIHLKNIVSYNTGEPEKILEEFEKQILN